MSTRFFLAIIPLICFCTVPAIEGFCQDTGEPDTLRFGEWAVDISGPPCTGEAVIPVIVFNDELVQGVEMPFTWSGPMSIDSLYLAEGRPDVFDIVEIGIDTSIANMAWIMALSMGEPMSPGTGPIAYLHFTVYDTGWAEVGTLVTAVLWLHFADPQAVSWPPVVVGPSQYHVQCCTVGDMNCDGIINVGDVVYLINYLYRGGSPPDSLNLADVNGDCEVNVGDVVYLLNYLYRNGPVPLAGCVS